ncbi:MAG: alpha/beta hydrolase [archaeon]
MEERVTLEKRRRELSESYRKPTLAFGRLARSIAPIAFDVPAPDDVFDQWASDLEDPSSLYGEPESASIETSAAVAGPGTREYIVRFQSPSEHVDPTAYARVYEPVAGDESLPTMIFHSGLGMMNDSLPYWPEEEYIGRNLAPQGIRVILPEAPWSGRRELSGSYSGEPYLAHAPVGLFQSYGAAVQETAILTAWARQRGAPRVGLGGMSLGGIVTAFVIGHAGRWPEGMRPDAAFPVAFSTEIVRLLQESTITELLEVTSAVREAGWNGNTLSKLTPLLRAPSTPGIAPGDIYPFAGINDDATLYKHAESTLDEWDVPDANRTVWPTDHFGVYFHALRGDEIQRRMIREMTGQASDGAE